MKQTDDAVVFTPERTGKLRYGNIRPGSVTLAPPRGTAAGPWLEGRDFRVDCAAGVVHALNPEIPDYSASAFCGQASFDHTGVPGYGNSGLTCWAGYDFEPGAQPTDRDLAMRAAESSLPYVPPATLARYMVMGDSISTGCEATEPERTFFARFRRALQERTGGAIEMLNAAIGGETSEDGVRRFEERLRAYGPQLVTLAYGMNDQCRKRGEPRTMVPPDRFMENIEAMLCAARRAGSDVILVTPCISNPRWHMSGGNLEEYAARLRELAEKHRLPLADVTAVWQRVLHSGKTHESLLYNDINHPNDYGHTLYGETLNALLRR